MLDTHDTRFLLALYSYLVGVTSHIFSFVRMERDLQKVDKGEYGVLVSTVQSLVGMALAPSLNRTPTAIVTHTSLR